MLHHKPDSFPARDVVVIAGLLPIFLYGCKINYGSGLGTRQDITKTTVPNNNTLSPRRGLIHISQLVSDLAFFTQQLPVAHTYLCSHCSTQTLWRQVTVPAAVAGLQREPGSDWLC